MLYSRVVPDVSDLQRCASAGRAPALRAPELRQPRRRAAQGVRGGRQALLRGETLAEELPLWTLR